MLVNLCYIDFWIYARVHIDCVTSGAFISIDSLNKRSTPYVSMSEILLLRKLILWIKWIKRVRMILDTTWLQILTLSKFLTEL